MAQQQPMHHGAASEPEALRNLMVNYIPTTIDEMQLRQLFEMYGPIESIKIVCDRETRQSKGYGFVKYRFAFSAMHAIQYLNGYPLMNKRLKVAYANVAEAQKASTTMAETSGMGAQAYPQGYPGGMPGMPGPGQDQQGQAGGMPPMPSADPNNPMMQNYMQQMAALHYMQQQQQMMMMHMQSQGGQQGQGQGQQMEQKRIHG